MNPSPGPLQRNTVTAEADQNQDKPTSTWASEFYRTYEESNPINVESELIDDRSTNCCVFYTEINIFMYLVKY